MSLFNNILSLTLLLCSIANVLCDDGQVHSSKKSTEACECFFQLKLTRGNVTDLGHRVVETVAAMTMAAQHKCTFLFDRDGFTRGDYTDGGPGEFSNALQFLQLHADELVLDDLTINENGFKPRIVHSLDLVRWPFERLPHLCGTLFRGRLDDAELCRDAKDKPQPCIDFAKYDNFKWRKKNQKGTTTPAMLTPLPPIFSTGLRERFSRQIQPRIVPVDIALTVSFHLYDLNSESVSPRASPSYPPQTTHNQGLDQSRRACVQNDFRTNSKDRSLALGAHRFALRFQRPRTRSPPRDRNAAVVRVSRRHAVCQRRRVVRVAQRGIDRWIACADIDRHRCDVESDVLDRRGAADARHCALCTKAVLWRVVLVSV